MKNEKNENEFISSLVNKKYQKLDLILLDDGSKILDFVKGTKMEITGDLQENGTTFINHSVNFSSMNTFL